MSGYDHGQRVKNKLESAFGGELTAAQIDAVVGLAKLVRFRARNNAALPNLMGRVFPYARFRNVPRVWNHKTYQALEVTLRGVPTVFTEEEDEAEAA